MSNKQNDEIAEQQAEQEQDTRTMLGELLEELMKILNSIAMDGSSLSNIDFESEAESIINLFRKYKEAI